LRSDAQDFHGALEEAFKLTGFHPHARIASFGKLLRRNSLVFDWLPCVVVQIHGYVTLRGQRSAHKW